MASISKEPGGRRTVQFVGGDGKRRSIRLGRASQKTAETVRTKIEHLVSTSNHGTAMDEETARWIAALDSQLHDRLSAAGLVSNREESAQKEIVLGEFIEQYIKSKQIKKPNTLKNYQATQKSLVRFFGEDRKLRTISAGDCDDWYSAQVGAGFASATIGRNVKRAKQYFRAAVRKRLISENPMAEVKASPQVNDARMVFVLQETINRVIEHCPDSTWRLIFSLARYGGLRVPSEIFALKWGDVDWERSRLTIRASKTEHHRDGGVRTIPLFPELRCHLEAAFDEAQPGTEYVVSRHRNGSANLRSQAERIILRAGEKPWERLFQNLRASRETELTQKHPLHVVTAWIGNSAIIASQHYLMVKDSDFDDAQKSGAESGAEAVQNPVQQPAAGCCSIPQERTKALTTEGLMPNLAIPCVSVQNTILPPRGVEQTAFSSRKQGGTVPSGAESGAVKSDFDMGAWSNLSPEDQKQVLAFVRKASLRT